MRNEIVRKNLILTASTLIIFFLISLFITSYFNKKSMEKQLFNLSTIIYEQFSNTKTDEELKAVVYSYIDKQDWVEVSAINSLGIVIYHSASDEYFLSLSEGDLKKLNDPAGDQNIYQNNNDIYMIIKVTEDLYLMTSMPLTNETTFILNSVFFIVVLLIIVFMLSYLYNNKIADNVIETFKDIETHLKKINSNENEGLTTKSEYDEVKASIKAINEISLNITTLINTNKQEKDKMKFVFDKMQQGLFVVNNNKHIVLVNSYAKRVFLGKEIGSPDDLPPVIQKQLSVCFEKKEEVSFDCVDEEKDKIYSYHLHYMDEKWDINDPRGIVIGLIIDATIERKNQELKSEFITNATHELKTPLTSITGFSELLSKDLVQSNELRNEYAAKIHQVALSMKLTVENLLFLSTLDDPNSIHLTEVVRLKKIVRESADKYFHEASLMGVKINLVLEDNIIIGNTLLITYLVNNLLENAIRYNVENGSISISNKSDDRYIYLTVKDTGKGIDKKDLSKIFEKFYRVPQEGAKAMGSTGIGLSIVDRIASIHNAKIEISSKPNKGSEFIIIFKKGEKEK